MLELCPDVLLVPYLPTQAGESSSNAVEAASVLDHAAATDSRPPLGAAFRPHRQGSRAVAPPGPCSALVLPNPCSPSSPLSFSSAAAASSGPQAATAELQEPPLDPSAFPGSGVEVRPAGSPLLRSLSSLSLSRFPPFFSGCPMMHCHSRPGLARLLRQWFPPVAPFPRTHV